jgi:hypothetical protein
MKTLLARIGQLFGALWSALRSIMGFDRVGKSRRGSDLAERSRLGRMMYFLRPALALVVLVYMVLLFVKFTIIHGDELTYPQRVLTDQEFVVPPGQRRPSVAEGGPACEPSQIVAVTSYILDVLVNQNTWVPVRSPIQDRFLWPRHVPFHAMVRQQGAFPERCDACRAARLHRTGGPSGPRARYIGR